MKNINWTRNGETGTKKVHDHAYDSMVASFRRAGYTVADETPVAAPTQPVTEAPAAGQTGRVGRGREVHRITAGHTDCGASYRRNSLGSTTRQVSITGEPVTCRHCNGSTLPPRQPGRGTNPLKGPPDMSAMTLTRPAAPATDDYADSILVAVAIRPGREARRYARALGLDQAEAGRTLLWLARNGYVRQERRNGRAVYFPA